MEAHPASGTGQALIALACSPAPKGHDQWTLRLLADKTVELGLVESLAPETVRLRLKKTLKRWQKKQWCIPKVSADPVLSLAHMEDVLDLYAEPLYAEPYDPQRPVVCFDETSTQMLSDARPAIGVEPGKPRRQDYEYRREGTRNLFLACEPLAGWRHVAVTERRTIEDFAHQMRWLVDEAYPDVPVVPVVLDNLNTHRTASRYQTFPAPVARRIAKRLEFHYTPKHGTWLNIACPSEGWGRRSSSASSLAVASDNVSPTKNRSAGRSRPWNWSGTRHKLVSTGSSVPRMREVNCVAFISAYPHWF